MVFNAISTTFFFENNDGMALSHRTRGAIAAEGIVTPEDLTDFTKDSIEDIFRNLRKPAKVTVRVANVNQLREVEPFHVSAKSKMRLLVALHAAKYYELTTRALEPDNMSWTVLKSFDEQSKALLERKDTKDPEIPKLTKGLSVPKWAEAIRIHLRAVIGVRGVPLLYVVRTNAAVSAIPPVLLPDEPHSEEHGSIEQEMVARASHRHALFKVDNGAVYDVLDIALRGTGYAPTIVQFRRTRDGREAFLAMIGQHAGKDVWETMIRNSEEFVKTRKWTGTTNVTLASHMAKHRSSHISLTEAAEHIPVETPNERTRVTDLMVSITSKDPDVLAALAAVRQDEAGMRIHFEETVAFLLPTCPVAKKQASRGKGMAVAEISGASAKGLGSTLKAGKGSTGVELRYHRHHDFKKLPKEQRDELVAWMAANKKRKPADGKGGDTSPSTRNKHLKKMISSALAEPIKALVEANTATIAALTAASPTSTASVSTVSAVSDKSNAAAMLKLAEVAAVKLQGILKAKADGKS